MQGLFYAPLVIGETLRGLDFAASLFAQLGFEVDPLPGELRTDIVQAIRLGVARGLIAFARGLQSGAAGQRALHARAGPVPGYVDPVIMSSGSFIGGATIDLSCDAPLREPWDVYLQGGIVAEHVALGAILAGRRGLLDGRKSLTHEPIEVIDDAVCRLRGRSGSSSDPEVGDGRAPRVPGASCGLG